MRPPILRLVSLHFAACLLVAASATAQPFYGVAYRPADTGYDILETEHFDVIYQRGLDSFAVRVAQVAEDSYPQVSARAGLRHGFRMPIILNGYNDASNGFVSPLPFRMEIDSAPIKGKILNPRHEDWFAQVVPHELAHAAQAEIRGGFGVGAIIRFFSPDWGRALNFGVPRGITEGFAVSYESQDPSLGRLNYSFTMMQARAAASSRRWTTSQVFDPPGGTRPFDRFYVGGGILYDYIADSLRADFLVDAVGFYNRWPFLGFGIAMWQSLGEAPWTINNRFLQYAGTNLAKPASPDRSFKVLTDRPGLACRRPKWLDDRSLAAFCAGYHSDRGIYLIDAETGERTLLSREGVTEDYFTSLDNRTGDLLFAEYDPVMLTDDAFHTRLKRIDVRTGSATVIPNSNRLYAPTRMPDGSILAIENRGVRSNLVRIDSAGGRETIFGEPSVRVLETDVNDAGEMLALVNRPGMQTADVASYDRGELGSLSTMLRPARGSVYDPVWSSDGGRILFSADPDGVPNVYVLDRRSGEIRRLTDAAFGAFEPDVSPDGTRLAFVRYVHEQYQIVVGEVPVGVAADSLFASGLRPRTVRGGGQRMRQFGTRPYRAFPAFLRPRSVVPIVRVEESELSDQDRRLGPGFGLAVGGTDPLRQWAYSLTGFVQEDRLWGALSLQTGLHALRPFVVLSDRPSSVVRPVGGNLARIAYEERSAEVGVSLPLRLESGGRQSFVAAGASAEVRSIRFLDSNADPITEFDDRVTLNPSILLGYGLKANPRDLVPNGGVTLFSRAEVDVKTDNAVEPSRSWRSDASIYLPVFHGRSTRATALFGALWQNRGSVLDVETFLPRGYEEEDVFLGAGTFLKAGLEIIQPVLWLDRGIVLIPISLQAIYLYGFTESVGRSLEWSSRRSSIGAGLGVRLLIAHHLGIEARIGVARLLEDKEWAVTGR